eukprot:TRINITY_DN34868_c0_g1_i1.p1 TRINITY_DN34868_c0_g1~~TRINITY_DN34868_c0_g1_i1.p1  ORF type:complete len:128 (+),score=22.28 TRINITY_DN34868_c0_g1_i1:443-826(+)
MTSFGDVASLFSSKYETKEKASHAKIDTGKLKTLASNDDIKNLALLLAGNAGGASLVTNTGAEQEASLTAIVTRKDDENTADVQIFATLTTGYDVSEFLPFEASVSLYQVYDLASWVLHLICAKEDK